MDQQQQPLTAQDVANVLTCLKGALNQNTELQKQAESYLSTLEHRPGFCSCLAEIVGAKDNDHSARWLASVHFKNSISRNWRGKPGQGISKEEKAYIKSKLSQLIAQDDNQIAVQVALVYAKIARFDYPREWPSLFADVMANLGAQNTLTVRRIYLILHHILKELSSKRLIADQKNFAEITQLLFSHIWGQWYSDTQSLLNGLPAGLESPQAGQPLLVTFERWLLLLKILRRLILFGFTSDAKSLQPVPAVHSCMPPMAQALQQMVALRPQRRAGLRSHLLAMLDRGILKLVKTHCQVQEAHPWSYHAAGVLLPTLGFCCDHIMAPREPGAAQEQFQIQCMTFVINVLSCGPYKGKTASGVPASDHEQDTPIKVLSSEVRASLATFWTCDRLSAVCSATVSNFFILTFRDLEEWSSSSEEFYHASDISGWHDHVNLAAENLFLTLLVGYREQLAPVVVGMLQQASSSCPAGVDLLLLPGPKVRDVPNAVLVKEAVYNAVAVGAYELHDYVDFTPWLRSTLLQELSNLSSANRPIRRRIIKLIGQWVARIANEDRPAIYRALLAGMAEDDMCMQLTAINCLRILMDDWNFLEEQFVEFVGPCMQLLIKVLSSSTELDTQTQAFNLINLIIERLGDSIRPYVEAIMGLLPQLWQDAEGQSLVRIQILLALQRLVNVLGPDSPASYPLLLPVLQHSLSPHHPDSLNLLEDGLGLWLVALRNTPSLQPALLQLFPLLVAIMAASTEHIQLGMQAIASCVLMGGTPFLQQHAQDLVSIFCAFLGNVRERGMLLIFPVLDLIMTAAPGVAAELLQLALLRLLALIMSGQESALTVANSMTVFARLLLQNPAAFMALFATAASQGLQAAAHEPLPPDLDPAERLLAAFIETWTDNFDGLVSPRSRKLCVLALCELLAQPSRVVLLYLDAIFAHITGVWHEHECGGDNAPVKYGIDFTWGAGEDGLDVTVSCTTVAEDAEGELNRRRQLQESDPVVHVKIGELLRQKLQQSAALHGQAFQSAMGRLDATIAMQLKSMVGA